MALHEGQTIGTPSLQESMWAALDAGAFEHVAGQVFDQLKEGGSPRILSIARPDLLMGLSKALWPMVAFADTEPAYGYKAALFEAQLPAAEAGDPAAISALPKLATTVGQLGLALECTFGAREAVAAWRTGRTYVQFIGSFNPQHIGHRTSIANTLEAAGSGSSAIVQVVENHPIKKDSLPPYRGRFESGEQKLLVSTILDPQRVHAPDLPLGLGLAKKGAEQIGLIARVAGDAMRWQVGSDKFMTDVASVRAGQSLDKAGVRFNSVHLYVARRDTHELPEVMDGIAYVQDRFDAQVTLVPESPDPLVLTAAASKIRAYRAAGSHALADAMEFSDMPGYSH